MKNRVFGCAIVKVLNANYNADFTGSPRTLPNGNAYATDKAFKYTIRNYIVDNYKNERVLYFTKYNDKQQPMTLGEAYISLFGEFPKEKKEKQDSKKAILQNLLECIDIRLFGATFAEKDANFSLHGNIQISHGVNIFEESNIYTEEIVSPFKNSNDKSQDSMQTTIGNQTRLEEGHFLHNFSINPKNLEEFSNFCDGKNITQDDYKLFKEALNRGATYLDSTSMAGVENEFSLFIKLKEDSKAILPSFISLIEIKSENKKRIIDLSKLKNILQRENLKDEIDSVEIYINELTLEFEKIDNVKFYSIIDNSELG